MPDWGRPSAICDDVTTFLLLTHACPSVECAIGRDRELTAPCAPWLAAAAPEKERKREAHDGGRHVCFFRSSSVYYYQISETGPVASGAQASGGRGQGDGRPGAAPAGRRSDESRDAAPTISRGTRNGRRDARGVGGNRTQRRRQMRRRRAGSSSSGAGCGRHRRQAGTRAGTPGRAAHGTICRGYVDTWSYKHSVERWND